MPFEHSSGWLAFLSIMPLIIIYLRKPKPNELTIPSLMFFMQEKGVTRFKSLFQHLFRNLLFLLQLLTLLVLSFALTGFFRETSSLASGNTAIVLDVSASMQTLDSGQSRFDRAVEQAGQLLSGKTTLILAADMPRVVLQDAGKEEAKRMLGNLQPLDVSSNIGDAILVAKDSIKGKGTIYVLSDFIATEGIDPLIAKRAASQGAIIQFINFAGKARNAGIIGMDVGKSATSVAIKNFDEEARSFKVKVMSNGALLDETTLNLEGNSAEEIELDTSEGYTEVVLDAKDDFEADNRAFISVPKGAIAKVLLITNEKNTNIEAALRAARNVALDIATPPVVSSFDYDVIVLHRFKPELMLSGFYREMESAASNGSSVIITAQEDLDKANIRFLPVELTGTGGASRNDINITNYFTGGIDFGVNERYLTSKPKTGTTSIVSAENSPVVAISNKESGSILYYGLLDDYSTFKSSITYPQFWSRLINFLTKTEDLANYNFHTGRIEVISEQSVTTPSGTVKTDRVLFDKNGFYAYSGRKVAANLLNPKESAVSADPEEFEKEDSQVSTEESEQKEKKRLESMFAAIAAILIFLELLYIKFRGDI